MNNPYLLPIEYKKFSLDQKTKHFKKKAILENKMDNIISLEEFEPTNVVLKDLKPAKFGSKIPVVYKCPKRGEIPLLLKLPKCDTPYGYSQFPSAEKVQKGKENDVNYSLQVSFTGHDSKFKDNEKVGMLFNKLVKTQEHVQSLMIKDCQKYMKKPKVSKDTMSELFTPIIKYSKDKATGVITNKYAPTFSFKLPRYSKNKDDPNEVPKFSGFKIFNVKDEEVSLTSENLKDIFPRYSEIKGLILCTGVANVKTWSMPFSAVQVKVYPGKNQITENAFADDSDHEDHGNKEVKKPTGKVEPTPVEEEDEEEEEVEVEEEEDE